MTVKIHLQRRRPANRTQIIRRFVQITFLLIILAASIRHILFEGTVTTASIDALCPFGGLETLWLALRTGEFVPKTHPSNLVLGLRAAGRDADCRRRLLWMDLPLRHPTGWVDLAANTVGHFGTDGSGKA